MFSWFLSWLFCQYFLRVICYFLSELIKNTAVNRSSFIFFSTLASSDIINHILSLYSLKTKVCFHKVKFHSIIKLCTTVRSGRWLDITNSFPKEPLEYSSFVFQTKIMNNNIDSLPKLLKTEILDRA